MDFLRQLFGIDPTHDDFYGTWKTIFNFSTIQGEELTLYGNNGKFVSVIKYFRLPNLPYSSKLYVYASGSFYIKGGKLHHSFDEIKDIYNFAVPQQYVNGLMHESITVGPSEIISFDKEKIATKNIKSGITMTFKRVKKDINPDDIGKFIKEENS